MISANCSSLFIQGFRAPPPRYLRETGAMPPPPLICVKRVPFVKLAFFFGRTEHLRETGAICQIGVFFRQNGAFLGPKKRPFSAVSHYTNSDGIKYRVWSTFIENVVRNRREKPFWDQSNAPFPVKTPI